MLGLIIVVIMMGFPTAFTLMGLGMFFGFYAYYDPTEAFADNRVFDLMVQRTYGAMTNDVLISIPLFVLMGYVMERGALVEKMYHAVQLSFRGVPASLAVATLVICTFWGIASGLVGAVVVLMGVIAMGPMLRAGYDTRLAAGVITAGGTLGILIPPSVMIIVYAAVAGESVVRLYAATLFPGFFLAFLYLVYIVGWALLRPRIAPPLPPDELVVAVPDWTRRLQAAYAPNMALAFGKALLSPARARAIEMGGRLVGYGTLLKHFLIALVPLLLLGGLLVLLWYYFVLQEEVAAVPSGLQPLGSEAPASSGLQRLGGPTPSGPQPLGGQASPGGLERLGGPAAPAAAPAAEGAPPPSGFPLWFWAASAGVAVLLVRTYARMTLERFEVLRLLSTSMLPLGLLTVTVLAVILLGITTATESAAVGAAGAFLLALQARTLDWKRTKEAVFLTAKTTAMVCWLFVGSALFSGVFAILGGQALLESWVLGLDLTPLQFLLLSQAVIFVLGWPLEWTEIIIIFVPIFLPLLDNFGIDPVFWGVLVFVNLQAAFLSPPVAMSAYYLKGVSPPQVTLNQIFAGMMPYMLIVILCMVVMYVWPALVLGLPNYLYGE
jgi:TRAP-type mannitol/chloroaromatic compound transport system permease large subunit